MASSRLAVVAVLASLACRSESTPVDVQLDRALVAPPTLSGPPPAPLMTTDSDLAEGMSTRFVVNAVPGGSRVVLLSSASEGAGPCPPQLGGGCLGIVDPVTVVGTTTATASGVALFDVSVAAPDGSRVAYQAAVAGTGATSNARTFDVGGCVGGPVDTGDTGGADSWIAFHSFRTGSGDIYLVRPDGTGLTQVTSGPDEEEGADISPDGMRLAWSNYTTGELVVADIDGTGAVPISIGRYPAWSPDGTRIAFSSNRTGTHQVYVINADGTGETQLTFNAMNTSDVHWSPDGSQLVYSVFGDIWLMNADGTGQTAITTTADWDAGPQWSPDGTRIVMQSTRGGQSNIWTMDIDGSNLVNVTQDGLGNERPTWSPDGTRLAWRATIGYNSDIWVGDADGSNRFQLTTDPAGDFAPDWR